MAAVLPSPPNKVKPLDSNGFWNPIWDNWFFTIYRRVGEAVAQTNLELSESISSNASLVTTLSATVTAQAATILSLQSAINDLKQGRDL